MSRARLRSLIFITAVVFLAWFFIGGYAAPGA
ncbi:YoaK family small membrane protein [Escherichia coli]|nr:YoaK family small membrane protein [Escherichia coli]EFF6678582.1 YoaK family small membrane protein [Escherichia coli]EFI7274012.1 YoaK family small membrane protein [Escherichia coli]EIJ0857766.1 YoaK family small membrane protein [Escherichia coli]EJM6673215.1 YoaK family small membrane protein [Escherichia coli]